MADSIILNTDSYKASMWTQYPPKTEYIYSYIESRGGKYDEIVFFGLQAFIKEYLMKPITIEDINYAESVWIEHGEPFNREGWEYILNEHKGLLPLLIEAIPEGTVVGVKTVLATVVNTDPKCYWLTTWVETALLRAIWYPTTVATQSWQIKQTIKEYLERTGDVSTLGFKLHDFGARGVSSLESASIGGAAHLVNFMGSDTISGALFARKYYGATMPAYSIPAAEHSTITSWGRDHEVDAYRNMIQQFGKPNAIYAVVSDSYDIFNAAENLWGGELRQEVIDSGAMLVIRPDSGDPIHAISHLLKICGEKFGYTTNDKGFKVLNNVRLIQGDGIDEVTVNLILGKMFINRWSADNVAFGMGGALLQRLDRDTLRFAMKCSAAMVDGKWRDVYKEPKYDAQKASKRGLVTSPIQRPVYMDGKLLVDMTFDEVRKNSQ